MTPSAGPPDHDIADAAVDWCIRLHDAECSASDRAAFQRWLARDPRHAQEYQRVERTWQLSGLIPAQTSRAPHRVRRTRRPLATAAMLLIGLVLAGWGGWEQGWLPNNYHRYQAERELQRLVLPDGSELELDQRSTLSFANFKDRRQVWLSQGSAYFHASRDQAHPFQVKAGQVTVTVTGTRFSVRALGDEVRVTVAEGSVEVASHADGEDALLTPGTQARYRKGQDRPEVGAVDLDTALAWRSGRLVLNDLTLAEALPLINPYLERPLVLADAATGELRVGGVFGTGNLQALVQGLPQIVG
ncbi:MULTISPECIES: FecR family protein [unclassified Pseudomonas]|uniref:FecR family protein n=1 Tax=unclassified Pseudomonas TaxID=196821 RepID=UPI00131D25D1|nr:MULTISPECIES: FecR family protein [unclassified Pseudomonas]